jgi:Animal haem peroxidase
MPTTSPHGARPLRGLESTAQSTIDGQAKFGRMFRWLEPAQKATTRAESADIDKMMLDIAEEMVTKEFPGNIKDKTFAKRLTKLGISNAKNTPDAPLILSEENDENDSVPAGYTYLGQFIDHDITFDPASSLQMTNDPDALVDFRTPRLDLDSVYGRGPADQPYLYDKANKRNTFTLGKELNAQGSTGHDVPRSPDKTAIIGDKRNDENKIVTQIQALFLSFHNKVYDKLGTRYDNKHVDDRFNDTQRIVRWCYQWIVLRDYLQKVCDPKVYDHIKPDPTNHKGPNLNHFKVHGDAYIPVEFAAAAFRFGHSMVRPSYALSTKVQTGTAQFTPDGFGRIPIFVVKNNMGAVLNTDSMNGFGMELPSNWGIDWSFFFGPMSKIADGKPQVPQPSYRIDTKLVDPLGELPEFFGPGVPKLMVSLAARNLSRGVSMGLPSGQRIARMMGLHEDDILSDTQLWKKKCDGDAVEDWEEGVKIFNRNEGWLKGSAPLWFYILKEAEINGNKGRHLGIVGSTIVAETLFGIAWADHYSYIFQEPQWNPSKEKIKGLDEGLDMLQLTQFVGSAP